MATLQDIADRAGVSKTSVSLALNGKGSISAPVRERVFRIAREIGYSKLLEARNTSRGLLAVLIHEDYEKAFEWHFIRNILIQLESGIMEAGYHPVLVPVSGSIEPSVVVSRLAAFTPRGVFSIHYAQGELFEYFDSVDLPLVVVNNSAFQDRFATVCTDDFQGASEGIEVLFRLGHRRIAFLDYPRPDLPEMVRDTWFGYGKAYHMRGLTADPALHVTVDLADMEAITEAVRHLLEREEATALFALDDYLAVRLWRAVRNLGLHAPAHVSILAPGDTLDYREPYIPQLTTMRVDTARMGQLAASLMLDRLEKGHREPTAIRIKQTLVDRGSIAAPDGSPATIDPARQNQNP